MTEKLDKLEKEYERLKSRQRDLSIQLEKILVEIGKILRDNE